MAANQGIIMPRYPGYIDGSEWYFNALSTYQGAYAASTSLVIQAAGGTRIKNVITDWTISVWTGGTAASLFWYIVDGAAASWATLNKDFFQVNLPINSVTTYVKQWPGDNPLIMSLNTATNLICTPAGVANLSCLVSARGYKIAA